MPMVCRYKPNRAKRHFKLKDIDRILGDMMDEGVDGDALVAVALIATHNLHQLEIVKRKLTILSWLSRIITVLLVATRIRAIFTAVRLIVAEVADRLKEFPGFRDSVSILEQMGVIGRAVVGLIGGAMAVVRLLFSLESPFVDDVLEQAYAYQGVEAPSFDDFGAAGEEMLKNAEEL